MRQLSFEEKLKRAERQLAAQDALTMFIFCLGVIFLVGVILHL